MTCADTHAGMHKAAAWMHDAWGLHDAVIHMQALPTMWVHARAAQSHLLAKLECGLAEVKWAIKAGCRHTHFSWASCHTLRLR